MKKIKMGGHWRGKRIRAIKPLSNGQFVIKTDNKKSKRDFKVKTIFSLKPQRSITPKHAHFAIDLYGKFCSNKKKTELVLEAIVKIWQRNKIDNVLNSYKRRVSGLPGYSLEYILNVLEWILRQEDINFYGRKRPQKKQNDLDALFKKHKITVPKGRRGSQLCIALLCYIISRIHPVEAFLKVNLRI